MLVRTASPPSLLSLRGLTLSSGMAQSVYLSLKTSLKVHELSWTASAWPPRKEPRPLLASYFTWLTLSCYCWIILLLLFRRRGHSYLCWEIWNGRQSQSCEHWRRGQFRVTGGERVAWSSCSHWCCQTLKYCTFSVVWHCLEQTEYCGALYFYRAHAMKLCMWWGKFCYYGILKCKFLM